VELLADIRRAVESSPTYRDRQRLIEAFIDSVNADGNINDEGHDFLRTCLSRDFEALVADEGLDEDKARALMRKSWSVGHFEADGRDVSRLVRVEPPKHLSPLDQFKWLMLSKNGGESVRESRVREVGRRLLEFFERYFGLVLFEESGSYENSNNAKQSSIDVDYDI
jgi:type I restriction enzyme R subunit